jgi:hypothetical protein
MDKALIYTKIPKIMSLVGVIGKDRTNTMQGYKFRGIDDMYNALNEHLSKEGIFVTSKVIEKQREERQSAKGGLLLYSILTMEFEFFAEDGSSVKSTTVGESMDSGDKSMNKAMSTAYKYALMQIFCIPTEEEKDTEYQSPEIKKTSPSPLKQTNNDGVVREPINNLIVHCGTCNSVMTEMKGVSKTTGKPYHFYKCSKDQTHPLRNI